MSTSLSAGTRLFSSITRIRGSWAASTVASPATTIS